MTILIRPSTALMWALVSGSTITAVVSIDVTSAPAGRVSCGQILTRDTVVGNDLLNCPGNALVVGGDAITLDLGGHIIDGIKSATSTGVDNAEGFTEVKIVNGTVQQFGNGVRLAGASDNEVEELTVLQNHVGIYLTESDGNTIEYNKVADSFDGVFLSESDRNLISDNDAFSSASSGIVIGDGSDRNTIQRNRAFDNRAWGIVASGGSENSYLRNTLFSTTMLASSCTPPLLP